MINCTIKQVFPQQNVLGWLHHVYIFYCDLLLEGLQYKLYYLLQTVNQNIFKHIVYRCVIGLGINHSTVGWELRLFVYLFDYLDTTDTASRSSPELDSLENQAVSLVHATP